jgi:hypothetical protein
VFVVQVLHGNWHASVYEIEFVFAPIDWPDTSKVFSFMYNGAVLYVCGVTMFDSVIVADFGLNAGKEEEAIRIVLLPTTVHAISIHSTLMHDTLAKLNPFTSKSTTILPNPLTTVYPNFKVVLSLSCLLENS